MSEATVPPGWLRLELGGWDGVSLELTDELFEALFAVGSRLNADPAWSGWWAEATGAPELWVGFSVYWPTATTADTLRKFKPAGVSRGRKRHVVRLHVDASRLNELPTGDRHQLAVPLLSEAFDWLVDELRLKPRPSLPGEPRG